MTRGGGVHTVPAKAGGWCNKVNGRTVAVPLLKKDAVRYGRVLARKLEVEHTIHRRDGVITEKNSYGNDPYPPKDGS